MMNGRGAGNRTRDLSFPKAALYQAELHPETHRLKPLVCPDRVAIRAHELAFRELFEDEFRPPIPHRVADLAELHHAGQVVPMHRLRWKDAAAIRAGLSGLQLA